ncbi:hypothetical protein PQX77_012350 [Marasmius sp. AFHP31]|nr:hypothetical protein PQX77_012350 [Marasmius sp. AFHP31]
MVVNVRGNQVNQIIQREEKEHTEFDDYRNVKSGDFCRLEDVCVAKYHRPSVAEYHRPSELKRWQLSWQPPCSPTALKTFCAVKVIGTEDRFTSVTYSGPDARRAFEEDFRKCSQVRRSSKSTAQVFAVDVGTVPSLLLWHALVPISHLGRNFGRAGNLYISNLCMKLQCLRRELWVDSGQGVICRGPEGPELYIVEDRLHVENRFHVETEKLPSTIDMLQEDVFMRFLASLKSEEADGMFLLTMGWDDQFRYWGADDVDVHERFDQPTIFSTWTKTPIAFANNVWTDDGVGLTEREVLENSLTRFRLYANTNGSMLSLRSNNYAELDWFSQSSSILQARGISLDDDLSVYCLFPCRVALNGYLDSSPSRWEPRPQQPIYLFVYPLPLPLTSEAATLHASTSGHHTKMVNPNCHPSHVLTSAFLLSSSFRVRPLHIPGTPGPLPPTTYFVNINYLEALTQQQPISPNTSDTMTTFLNPSTNSDSDNVDRTVTSHGCLSNTIVQTPVEYPTSMTTSKAPIYPREGELTVNSDCVTNKCQRRDTGVEGIERSNPETEFRRKNDSTTNDHGIVMEGQDPALYNHFQRGFCPSQPLSTRIPRFPSITLIRTKGTNRNSIHPTTIAINRRIAIPLTPQTLWREMCRLLRVICHELSQHTTSASYLDTSTPFNAYSSTEIANSASNLTTSATDLDYTAPSANSGVDAVADAPRYDVGATQSTGWSGTSRIETYVPLSMSDTGPANPPASYPAPAVTHLSSSATPIDLTHYPHSAAGPTSHMHDSGYTSPFHSYDGGTFVPQQHWNPPVAHHSPSYTSPSFSFQGVTYPSDSTVHAEAHLPYSAYLPRGHP